MSFKLTCPYCNAPLRLAKAPNKKGRTTCPKCDTVFHVGVQAETANGRTEKPRLRRRGLSVSEKGMPTGPPPATQIRRPVVFGGVVAAGAAALLAMVVCEYRHVPEDDWHFVLGACAAFAFGGHFTASLADERKLMHCFFAAAVGTILDVVFWVLQSHDRSVDFGEHLLGAYRTFTNSWELGAITAALFVSFMIGGLSERILTWCARLVGSRRRWHYLTHSGKRINAQGPWRHPVLAFFWSLVGVAFFLTFWTPFLLQSTRREKFNGSVSFLILGWVCLIMARKRMARDARDALEEDFDPPIVYLRSFRHDGRRIEGGILHDYNNMLSGLLTRTPERHLARIMNNFGPFVAIGKPGEELPEFGAARMYVEHTDWQAVVGDLLSQDGAVAILQAGETQGLRWELHRIGQVLQPEQVLLFVPFGLWSCPATREKFYTGFRSWAEECLGTRLPRKLGHSCFIYFTADPDWQAHTLEEDDEIPEDHPLWEILEALQDNRALWPRRGLMEGKLFRSLLIFLGVLLGLSAVGIVFYYVRLRYT